MKKNYIRCNKKTIEDSVVFEDLRKLSKGRITIESTVPLLNHEDIIMNSKRKSIKKNDFYHGKI